MTSDLPAMSSNTSPSFIFCWRGVIVSPEEPVTEGSRSGSEPWPDCNFVNGGDCCFPDLAFLCLASSPLSAPLS